MIKPALIRKNRFPAVIALLALAFILLPGTAVFAQQADSTITLDLNNDGKPDKMLHVADGNIYTLQYVKNGKEATKTVQFFHAFDASTANMSYGKKNGLLWFEIRYAPKYLDKDTLWFKYSKDIDDWRLTKITSYRFNPMDPSQVSKTCIIQLKKSPSLLKDDFEQVQGQMEDRKYILGRKCTEKQEQ